MLWRHRVCATCHCKGFLNLVNQSEYNLATDGTTQDIRIDDVEIGATSARPKAKCEIACKIIICYLGDALFRMVMNVVDDPARMLQLFEGRDASKRTVSKISIQTQLFRMKNSG